MLICVIYQISGKSSWGRHISADNNSNVYYLIDFSKLLSETREVTIVLELYGPAIKFVPQLDAVLAGNEKLMALDRNGYQSNTYWHFARKTYFWNPNGPNFSTFIVDCIEADFQTLMDEVVRHMHQLTNT